MKHLTKEGYLDKDGEVVHNPMMDELFQENEAITAAAYASITGKIAFGKNAGKYATRIGSCFGYFEKIPLAKGKRCYSINGFSLHCNINAHVACHSFIASCQPSGGGRRSSTEVGTWVYRRTFPSKLSRFRGPS